MKHCFIHQIACRNILAVCKSKPLTSDRRHARGARYDLYLDLQGCFNDERKPRESPMDGVCFVCPAEISRQS